MIKALKCGCGKLATETLEYYTPKSVNPKITGVCIECFSSVITRRAIKKMKEEVDGKKK